MAGDWIAWNKGLSRKPEVLAIAQATGRCRCEVVVFLMEFWEWCDDHTEDGNLSISVALLSHIVRDTDETFWGAVVAEHWLNVTETGIYIPNFRHWMGQSAKKRLQNTRRKQLSRHSLREEPVSRNGKKRVALLSRFEEEKSVVRVEESRVEKNKKEQKSTSVPSPLPPNLADDATFVIAWGQWTGYRKDRKKAMTPQTAAAQLKMLAGLGVEKALERIERSIRNGWIGLDFPEDRHDGNRVQSFRGGRGRERQNMRGAAPVEPAVSTVAGPSQGSAAG